MTLSPLRDCEIIIVFSTELPYIVRKIVLFVKPSIEVIWDDATDEFNVVVHFFYFEYISNFKLNEIVEEPIPFTGETVQKLVTKTDDGRYLAQQLTGKHKGAQYITEFDENKMIVQMIFRDVTAIRAWKKKM